MLADKIIELKRTNNLSKEELSEIVDVSKLTISKWESGERTPSLDQLNILCNRFNVSMDYFTSEYRDNTQKEKEYRYVSYDSAMVYVEDKKKVSRIISLGVFFCIVSVVPLLLLLFMTDMNYLNMTTSVSTTVGLAVLFGFVALGVGIFMQINRYSFDLDLKYDTDLKLDQGVKSTFKSLLDEYRPVYIRNVTIAIALILLSTVPLITVSILTQSGQLALLMVVVKLIIIAIGVSMIIPASLKFNELKAVVNLGEPKSVKNRREKRTEKVASFYWPLVTAVYLGWSLWTMAWGTTWILWPVAAVAFAALVGLLELFDKD